VNNICKRSFRWRFMHKCLWFPYFPFCSGFKSWFCHIHWF